MSREALLERDRASVIPMRENGAGLDMCRSARSASQGVARGGDRLRSGGNDRSGLGCRGRLSARRPRGERRLRSSRRHRFPLVLQTINTTG